MIEFDIPSENKKVVVKTPIDFKLGSVVLIAMRDDDTAAGEFETLEVEKLEPKVCDTNTN